MTYACRLAVTATALLVSPAAAMATVARPHASVLGLTSSAGSVVARSDATGLSTAVLTGFGAGARFATADNVHGWGALADLPGTPVSVATPALAASGWGSLAAAWRADHTLNADTIDVTIRASKNAALSQPQRVSERHEIGVRDPAIAISERGHVLVAWTRGVPTRQAPRRGALAVAFHDSRGGFGAPRVIVDRGARTPSLAIAANGRGVVAWSSRGHVYATRLVRDRPIGSARMLGDGDRPVVHLTPDGLGSIVFRRPVRLRPGPGDVPDWRTEIVAVTVTPHRYSSAAVLFRTAAGEGVSQVRVATNARNDVVAAFYAIRDCARRGSRIWLTHGRPGQACAKLTAAIGNSP